MVHRRCYATTTYPFLDLYTANHQPTKVKPCQLFTTKKKNQNKSSIHTIETLSLLLFSCLVFFLLLLILFAILQMFCYFALTESRLLFPVMYLSLWNWLRRRIWELVHRIARWECQTVLQAHRNPRFLYLWKQPTKPEEYSRKKKKTKSEKFCRLLVFFFWNIFIFVCLFLSRSFILFSLILTVSLNAATQKSKPRFHISLCTAFVYFRLKMCGVHQHFRFCFGVFCCWSSVKRCMRIYLMIWLQEPESCAAFCHFGLQQTFRFPTGNYDVKSHCEHRFSIYALCCKCVAKQFWRLVLNNSDPKLSFSF